jgi:hypothetical protein
LYPDTTSALFHESFLGTSGPEYPQKPAASRKRKTAIRIRGMVTHGDTWPLAGHRNATNGNAGFLMPVDVSMSTVFLVEPPEYASSWILLLLGLCTDDGVGGAISSNESYLIMILENKIPDFIKVETSYTKRKQSEVDAPLYWTTFVRP